MGTTGLGGTVPGSPVSARDAPRDRSRKYDATRRSGGEHSDTDVLSDSRRRCVLSARNATLPVTSRV